MHKLAISLLLVAIAVGLASAIREQSVAVRGRFLCGSAPARNVRVKLWEEDSGPDPDDLLEAGYTDANGEFSLKGSERETTNIDPVLKAYHDCDDGIKPGSRKIKFKIPSSYITSGPVAKKVFDLGTINLETIFANEERELIVSKRHVTGQDHEHSHDHADHDHKHHSRQARRARLVDPYAAEQQEFFDNF